MAQLLAVGGWLDPERLIVTFGTIGLLLIVFAESGLLIGFFLPVLYELRKGRKERATAEG